MSMGLLTTPALLSPSSIFTVNCVSYGSLVFQVYEWLNHLNFEISGVWNSSSPYFVRWQYLFSRYTGIAISVVVCLFNLQFQSKEALPAMFCWNWHIFQLISIRCMVLSMQITLKNRLLPLYHELPFFSTLISALVSAEFIAASYWGYINLHEFELQGACYVRRQGPVIFRIGTLHFIVHALMWILTFVKSNMKSHRLSLMMKDNSYIFGVTTAIYYTATTHLEFDFDTRAYFHGFFPACAAIIATLHCRFIINMTSPTDEDAYPTEYELLPSGSSDLTPNPINC